MHSFSLTFLLSVISFEVYSCYVLGVHCFKNNQLDVVVYIFNPVLEEEVDGPL